MRLKADLILLMVAVIWGTTFITQGIAAQYHTAYLYNGTSFLAAGVILSIYLRGKKQVVKGQWKWMVLAGVILFIASALQQVGIQYTKIANAGFITSLYTVFTPFLLWIGFKERPHHLDLAAVIIASLGAYLLSTSGSFQMHAGDNLELIGAVFWSLHFVVLGKFASRYEPLSFSAGQFVICGLLNLGMGFFLENLNLLTPLPVLGAVAYRAILAVLVGYTLQVWGQRHTPPTDAALILALEAVFAAICGWILLSQALQPIQIAGCLIIFFGVLLSQFKTLPFATQGVKND